MERLQRKHNMERALAAEKAAYQVGGGPDRPTDKSWLEDTDPSGLDAHTDGCKLDAGKPDLSLLQDFGKALEAVAEVGTYGKEKYSRGGWQHVDDGLNRYTAAMMRHFFAERYSNFDTDDSELLHMAQTAWNALARLELYLRKEDENA